MRVLHFAGRPAQIGEAFGEECREAIAELYTRRLENARVQALEHGGRAVGEGELLDLAHACLAPWEAYHADGLAELRGIARGAGLSVERVLAMNGLTDLRDALAWGGGDEACTAFLVQGDACADGRLRTGQTWDLGTDNAPFVVGVHRQPEGAPGTWCVTTVGCLSLMGINEEGIALGTTNLRTRDARPGVPYLGVIHKALGAGAFGEAVAAVLDAPRAGGHFFSVADRHGRAAALECTATRAHLGLVESGLHVHTNHVLETTQRALEADTPRASSEARYRRMRELLEGARGRLEAVQLRRLLADDANGELAICRDDFAGISTNAAIVVTPDGPEAHACAGLPSRSRWIELLSG